jgi:hypothetical protein
VEAGQGAAEQARRVGDRIVELEAQLEKARKTQQAWLAGAEGEARVGEQLKRLELHGWKILHDVHWPGRPRANIDHIAIGPGGVLVIDTKNWSGDVQLRDGVLRQNGFSCEEQTMSVLEQCSAVAVLLDPRHRNLAQGWICLVGQPDLDGRSSSGVTIVGIDVLVDTVRALPVVLEEHLIGPIHEHLLELTAGRTSPVIATTALLERTGATSSTLAARREAAARHPSAGGGTNRPAATPRPKPRSRRKKQPSCLGAFGRLVLLALILWMSVGALQSFNNSRTTPVPRPVPTVEQVAPEVEQPAPPG